MLADPNPQAADPRLPWLAPGRLPLYLAPMAGYTNVVFRQLCKEHGAEVMVTEFVMADKFLDARSERAAWEIVDFAPEQRPMGVQIFGGDPAKMAEAARRIAARLAPDFIDLNFGCPAPRVVNNCAGSSLLRDLPLLARVAGAVVRAVGAQLPVTAKIRSGWDARSIVAVPAARLLAEAGIAALTVHGRSKEQGYGGAADWTLIHAVADAVRIPVIGNGSLRTAADVHREQAAGKVRGVMIGRAALGYPWLFREMRASLAGMPQPLPPDDDERWTTLLRFCRMMLALPGAARHGDHINWLRPQLQTFTRGLRGSRELRHRLAQVRTLEELEGLRRLAPGWRQPSARRSAARAGP
jgi:nifR3 family TIM-barrel protein